MHDGNPMDVITFIFLYSLYFTFVTAVAYLILVVIEPWYPDNQTVNIMIELMEYQIEQNVTNQEFAQMMEVRRIIEARRLIEEQGFGNEEPYRNHVICPEEEQPMEEDIDVTDPLIFEEYEPEEDD